MLLKDKNIVLTGCNRGMGRAMLELFAENGADVWACARARTDEFERFLREIAAKHGVEIRPVYFDLSDNEQIKSAFGTIRSAKIAPDILVNNAGISLNALCAMTTMKNFADVFQVNFFGPMLLTQYVSKLMMKARSGSIVNIASTAGIDPTPGRTAYGASKAALISATQTLAVELGEYGIRANVVAPGITETDMAAETMTEAVVEESIAMTMLKRIGQPVDVARAALFLASDLSSYVTGQVLRVDGGLGRK